MKTITLKKMQHQLSPKGEVEYWLEDDGTKIPMNSLLGKQLQIKFSGKIHCIHCKRKTNKSFAQGFCFPCFRSLARCDMCLMKPETCHYKAGTCREPEWGEEHCLKPHTIYLANSSGLKVGITRGEDPVSRWIDQGAVAGIPLAFASERLHAGKIEIALKKHVNDKTNWRAMLKGEVEDLDLESARNELKDKVPEKYLLRAATEDVVQIKYPVLEYPSKIKSFNLDKDPLVEGTLQGIKGQYLIFDTGVINIRKYNGYLCEGSWA